MNLGHFSYLVDGSAQPQQTKLAADRLESLAKIAAKRYLEESTPLNATIQKMAGENDLNANQIERVCEMANIATHKGLWSKTASKVDVAFPLADARTVIAALQPTTKTASAKNACECGPGLDADYASPPPNGMSLSGMPSIMSALGIPEGGGHNGLTEEPERKKIIIILQKKAAERQRIADRVLNAGAELETLEKQAFHQVKQTVIGGATFRQVYLAAAGMGLGKVAAEYLPKFEERLIGETHGVMRNRLEKQAISKAPEDLISDDLGNMTIVNGAHPVLVSLDTVNRKTGEIRNGLEALLRIDDEVKIYHQKLRDLS